eukprot:s720_g3.t1
MLRSSLSYLRVVEVLGSLPTPPWSRSRRSSEDPRSRGPCRFRRSSSWPLRRRQGWAGRIEPLCLLPAAAYTADLKLLAGRWRAARRVCAQRLAPARTAGLGLPVLTN